MWKQGNLEKRIKFIHKIGMNFGRYLMMLLKKVSLLKHWSYGSGNISAAWIGQRCYCSAVKDVSREESQVGLSKLGLSCLWGFDRPKKQRLLMRWLLGKGAGSHYEENRYFWFICELWKYCMKCLEMCNCSGMMLYLTINCGRILKKLLWFAKGYQ